MRYNQLKKKLRNNIAQKEANRELYEHYQSLFKVALREHEFGLLQVKALITALEEIEVVADEKLIKELVELAKHRHNLDKIIHSKTLI